MDKLVIYVVKLTSPSMLWYGVFLLLEVRIGNNHCFAFCCLIWQTVFLICSWDNGIFFSPFHDVLLTPIFIILKIPILCFITITDPQLTSKQRLWIYKTCYYSVYILENPHIYGKPATSCYWTLYLIPVTCKCPRHHLLSWYILCVCFTLRHLHQVYLWLRFNLSLHAFDVW